MKMDAAYFIAKFEAIPEEKWTVGIFHGAHGSCALGHCGVGISAPYTDESRALIHVLCESALNWKPIAEINDGRSRYQQPTPKQRILAALRDAQKAGR